MADGVLPSTHRINLRDDGAKGQQYPVVLDAGVTVPTDGQSGYAKGAHFIHTSGANDATWYMNFGTAASCNFDAYQGVRDLSASSGGQVISAGDAVPTGAGYAPNALHVDTNAAAHRGILQNYGTAATADFDTGQLVRDVSGGANGVMFATGTHVPIGAGWGSGAAFVRACSSKTYSFGLFGNTGGAVTADFLGILTAGDAFPTAGLSASHIATGALHFDTDQTSVELSLLQNFGAAVTANFNPIQGFRDTASGADGMMAGTGTVLPSGQDTDFGNGAVFIRTTTSRTASVEIGGNLGGAITATFATLFSAGDSVPPTGAAGYAARCLFIDTNASTLTASWYVNVGSSTACTFSALTLTAT